MSFPTARSAPAAEGAQYSSFAAAAIDVEDSNFIGSAIELADGRMFRATLMGAVAGVANSLYQSEVPESTHDTLTCAAAAVGSGSFDFTNGTEVIAAGDYAGGYACIESVLAVSPMYRIKSIAGPASAATVGNAAVGTLSLYPGVSLLEALTTSHRVTLTRNPYAQVIIHPSPATAQPAGIPPVALAANAWGYVATRGIASYLVNGVAVIGDELCASSNVNGALGMKRVSGTGEVANGQTTDVITHNSGQLPVLGDINIEYGEDPTTAPATRFIGTFTSTQFTVNVETDPSTNGLDFSWTLEVDAPVVARVIETAPTADFGTCFLILE